MKTLIDKAKEFDLSQEVIDKKEEERLSFISEFPLDKIEELTIDEYVLGTDENSFCYWLEYKDILFGIGGGNSSKFGLYKAKDDGNYYTGAGVNRKQLDGKDLEQFFSKLKSTILAALEYTKNNEIEKIKTIDAPIWNMVLQKILSIYYPDKFITIGAFNVLVECAHDINIEGLKLNSENLIQINHECKKYLDKLPEFKDWSYIKLGQLVWDVYSVESEREYYVLGSKYGDNNEEDVFPEMYKKNVISVGFASNINLEDYYLKNHSQITQYLKERGEESRSYNALKYFLNLKVGDRVAIKADGSPKGKKGFLSVLGIAEVIEKDGVVYRYDAEGLGHLINVKFINAPIYEEFEIGGYGRTIQKVSKREHIETIFKTEHKETDLEDKRFWLYSPGGQAGNWEEFYNDGIMGLGWDKLDNLNNYESKDEIKEALDVAYGGDGSKKNDTTANDEFVNVMKVGDIVIAKRGLYELIGYGVVTSDYIFDNNRAAYKHIRKVEWKLNGSWKVGFQLVQKTLTDITSVPNNDPNYDTYYERLLGIMGVDRVLIPEKSKELEVTDSMKQSKNLILYGPPGTGKTYMLKNMYIPMFTAKKSAVTREEYMKDIIKDCSWWQVIALVILDLGRTKVSEIAKHEYIKIKTQLSNTKTVVPTIWGQLQSHTVEECDKVNVQRRMIPLIFNKRKGSEWEILESEAEEQTPELYELKSKLENFETSEDEKIERFEFLTFHQSYAYEDFIEGIKPKLADTEVTYEIEEGVFQKLCNRARNDLKNDYAVFIDEINRANISSIFGELITLIEDDKREGEANEIKATLPYSKNQFSVPNNVYIIGTMNTADRSVEALDTALRRRFSFMEMNPAPKKLNQEEFRCEGIDLERMLRAINGRIEKLLDRDYCIGHSYFMTIKEKQEPLEELKFIFQNKILPLLQEYFYGDWGKIQMVIGKQFVELKDNDFKFLDVDTEDDIELFEEKPIYSFTDCDEWTLASFKSIYEGK